MQQYCRNELHSMINKMKRADIVFDIYKNLSIKSTARQTRGFERSLILSFKTPIPKNWQNFLKRE